MESTKEKTLALLSLFTSASTLVCCALPALLVTLGMGAALAGLVTAVPQLIWLSEHKTGVFGLAAVLLLAGGWMQWNARNAPCPVDPVAAKSCMKLRRNGRIIYFISLGLYLTGFFFAFIAPKILGG
ncbi:MAG: hypothetical protein ACAH80_03795 [Alphaproteobacteria bacterium]